MDENSYLVQLFEKAGLSEFAAETVAYVVAKPLAALLILLVTFIVARILARIVRRLVISVHKRSPLTVSSVRADQRAQTLAVSAASVVKIAVWSIGVLVALETLGVNIGPIIAGAGIVGIALGFGAQTMVRDFLSGFLILVEDQYGVGDSVELNKEVSGTVEEVALHFTRLRSIDGTVHFVPNGEIRLASNSSMEWSKALIDIPISPSADLSKALELFGEEVQRVAASDEWSSMVTSPPEILGVESAGRDGVLLRAAVKTTPSDQYQLVRAMRAAVINRFHKEHIRMPEPGSVFSADEP